MHPALSAARERYRLHDWAEVVAASELGRRITEAHPGSDDLARAWRIAGQILHRGLIFKSPGRVNWRVAARAPVLSARQLQAMHRLGRVVDRFLAAASAALPISAWLRERLGFPVWPEEESLLSGAPLHRPAFIRLDLVPDHAGEFKLIEIQTVAGGLGITQGLREVHGAHPALPGIAAGLEEALTLGYENFCARTGVAARPQPVVAAYLGHDDHFRHELLVLASAMSRVTMVVSPWVRVPGKPFPSLDDGRVPDVLFRFFDSPRLLGSSSAFKRLLVERVADGGVCMINPWVDALDDKRLLAVLHDAGARRHIGGAVTDSDWQLLLQAVPRTWRLGAAQGEALKGRPRSERAVYLKKGRSLMSRGLVDGQQENRGTFDAAVEKAVTEGDWVVQEAVRGAPWTFFYLDQEEGALREMLGYVRLTPVYTRAADGEMRLADVCITARPQRSRVHGATDACIAVPGGGVQ
jgi:hypothetical protein